MWHFLKIKSQSKISNNWFGFIFQRLGYHFPGMFFSTLTMGLITALIYLLEYELNLLEIKIPIAFHSLMGLVVGLLLVFRTNTAYDRWWEGRRQWGALVANIRFFGLKIAAYIEDETIRNELFELLLAYPYTIKHHLRNQNYEEMRQHFSEDFMKQLLAAPHKPLYILEQISRKINEVTKKHLVSHQQLRTLEVTLYQLTDAMSACERIRNTPIPVAYALHLKRILLVYIITLPFSLIGELKELSIVVVMLIFYTMIGIETIGEEIEDPFGEDINDLPINQLVENMRNNLIFIFQHRVLGEMADESLGQEISESPKDETKK